MAVSAAGMSIVWASTATRQAQSSTNERSITLPRPSVNSAVARRWRRAGDEFNWDLRFPQRVATRFQRNEMASTEAEAPVVVDEPSTAFEVVHQLDTAIETKTHEEEEAVLFKMSLSAVAGHGD